MLKKPRLPLQIPISKSYPSLTSAIWRILHDGRYQSGNFACLSISAQQLRVLFVNKQNVTYKSLTKSSIKEKAWFRTILKVDIHSRPNIKHRNSFRTFTIIFVSFYQFILFVSVLQVLLHLTSVKKVLEWVLRHWNFYVVVLHIFEQKEAS